VEHEDYLHRKEGFSWLDTARIFSILLHRVQLKDYLFMVHSHFLVSPISQGDGHSSAAYEPFGNAS
jgi:hypothetical protein